MVPENKRNFFINMIILVFILQCHKGDENGLKASGSQPINLSNTFYYNTQALSLDPTNIPESLLAPLTMEQDREMMQADFEQELIKGKINTSNFYRFAPVLFFYRDWRVAKLFREIIADTSVHLFFRTLAVFSLGEYKDSKNFDFLFSQFSHSDPVYREYIASALVKLADSTKLKRIGSLLASEKNAYVCKTLMAEKKNLQNFAAILPVFDTSALDREMFYPSSRRSKSFEKFSYQEIDDSFYTPLAKKCIYPHQQYKLNRALYNILNYPVINFGLEDSWGRHVGEDSGWLFSGMPVHSIMDGVVVKIQHESTWGCLVVIQSRLIDSSFVTIYYGHLSEKLNVVVGDRVAMGDKIGEIALSFTLTNGGYLSHLHLGIEKSAYKSALIKGWFDTMENWFSPVAFIANYGKKRL